MKVVLGNLQAGVVLSVEKKPEIGDIIYIDPDPSIISTVLGQAGWLMIEHYYQITNEYNENEYGVKLHTPR